MQSKGFTTKIIKLPTEDLKPLEYESRWENSWELHWEIEFYETDGETSIDDEKPRVYTGWCVFVDVSSSSKPPTGYEKFLDSIATDRGSEPTRVRTEFPPLRDIPDDTGHQDVAQLARRWLQTCKDRHDCRSASEDDWYPKRLIHVGDDQQSPRLIISENERPDGCYAALSHCWGEDPKFLMLTSENLPDFCSEIQLQTLPASFRDAIITCRRIGIPYIWIDSLCILQSGLGSHEDWLSHSETMHLVYHNCALNISIDVSENPHGGAFRSRDPTYLQDCCVWSPFYAPPYSSSRNEHIVCDTIERPNLWNICAIFTADDFSWARVDLPLSNRAWVFQERLLSPRTLHFGSDRISWECDRNRNLTEYLPEGLGDDRWNGFDCLAQNAFSVREKADLFTYYYDLVFPYMDRQLSHPDEDKLVAFAAVARRCISWFGSDYCAGIFRSTMPQGLLWEMSPVGHLGRFKAYRAPSWSWASLDCGVRFDILDDEGTVLADIVDVAVELVDPNNQFGQVKSASLTLAGPLVASDALILKDANEKEFVAEGRPGRDGYQDIQTILGHTFGITADTVDLWEEGASKAWLVSQKNMYLLAVFEKSKDPRTQGLLVQKNNDGTFIRAGNWEAGPGHHTLTLLLDGKLTLVPLKDDIQVGGPSGHRDTYGDTDKLKRALDVGTGTGISLMGRSSDTDWYSDFADEHPNVEVIGTDLSSIQPSWVPPNVKFELEDATKDWSWHVRFLMGAKADWGTLFKEASQCCKTGGFVESGEINPTFYSDDGSIDDIEALQTWNQLVIESANVIQAPIGGWPRDEKMRKVGQFLRASIENNLEGHTMRVWHQIMDWPEDEYQVFLLNMRTAFKDKRIHGYIRVRYVYGQKPDAEK
ncbi:hypothetical protein FMUND_11895 [Fusarium mundagurra]|uniref:Heterokaryon incompatibility domain-containing protein n=1 Tax=Fusarium mundagurra TaxID=1567541 RepID=A0A8H5Y5I4_9HYPO|nr:hypothetical protein FMUND_11895 [Fusarium mundagurra]